MFTPVVVINLGRNHVKFRLRLLVAVTAAALLPLGAGPSTAAAEDGCAITDFSPRSVVVKDSVGVTSRGVTGENGKITVRVRRADGRIMQTTGDKVHWAPKPFIGAAPVDGVRGAEILVGDSVGAHYEQFRMITYRRGKLVTAPPPPKAGISNRPSRWGIDSR